VVRALAAIHSADLKPFRLVFGGGTALSRAYRLTRRMSEDIDLKIVSGAPRSRAALRRLRDKVTKALLDAGFEFDPANAAHRDSGNESRYTVYRLPDTPLVAGEGALRPEVQVETAVWALRLPSVEQSVTSFWAEAIQFLGGGHPAAAGGALYFLCGACRDGGGKIRTLSRRVGAELANAGGPRDKTLVRHVYDLDIVRSHYDPTEVVALAREIIGADVEAYGHQFPAYRENPVGETLRAVSGLATDDRVAAHYAAFLRDMVYGEAQGFKTALTTVSALADGLT
jgi:Nucleotidyl transferase AbiEii toxin, Type IV TA system